MKKTSTTTDNVISLADWKARKKTSESVKAVFKDSLDNASVMQRYNINEPTLEERMERIKNSVNRINTMLREAEDRNKC